MVKGSCLCGTVAFEVDPAGVVAVVGCYCEPCRKVSGSQYGVYYQVRRGAFRWLSGEDGVAAFESSPEAAAFFAGLATFYRKGYLRWIDGASRRPELRARRVRELIVYLEEGRKQRPR